MEIEYLVNMKGIIDTDGTDMTVTLDSENDDVEYGVLTDANGKQGGVEFTSGVSENFASLDLDFKDGEEVYLFGRKKVEGFGIQVRADKFPKKFKLTYRTIAYDPTTMEHVKDIIIQFAEVKPSANFDLSFEMSTPIAPEFTLTVLKPQGCNVLGRIVTVDPTNIEEDG